MSKPTRILWGAATSSFQIEGAATQDSKGPSIWDTFCRQPGKISDQSNGDVACDHYNRMESDVLMMKDMGLDAYRFSLAWSRIFPLGTGSVNTKGLDFYDRLTDALLRNGIEPFPTLYHWDLPQALEDLGGWTNPQIAHWFADYADVVVRRLGDRIQNWTTFNEPHVFANGYGGEHHAPGHGNRKEFAQSVRCILLAHGRASQAIRAVNADLHVGIVNCWPLPQPLDATQQEAALKMDQISNRIWFDPIIHGTVPDFAREVLAKQGVVITPEDLGIIQQKLDFVGINYYMRLFASATNDPQRPYTMQHPRYEGAQITDIGWEVYPDGLRQVLATVRDDYGNLPVYVTENGASYSTGISEDGHIHDDLRIEYYRKHLEAMQAAVQEGCNVRGYFAWSLMDNFEWSHGYQQRFGIVHVDYANDCKRTLKDSALWYMDYIAKSKG